MEPRAGNLVTTNLKLVRQLGRGGMGSVWVAEHLSLHTELAVKFISPEHADKKRFVKRFQREASSAAKIKSPHVVQIFDHGVTDDGVPYIVMELLEGETLAARLDRKGRLSLRDMRLLVTQVTRVLALAHERGIVHRDLKPDNLFLVESGYELFVKVLDFGIAKQTDQNEVSELTDTGALVGTPYFMSPEMVKSAHVDHRADLWALGVVAYRTLTGELPFRGETFGAIAITINEAEFEPPSALVEGLDPAVDAWFRLALCRNIQGRFQTAVEMADALREATKDLASGEHVPGEDNLPPTARVPGAAKQAASLEHHPAMAKTVTPAEAGLAPKDESGSSHVVSSDGPTVQAGSPHAAPEASASEPEDSLDDTRTSADQRRRESQPVERERSSTLGGAFGTGEQPRRRWPLAGVVAALLAGTVFAIAASMNGGASSGQAADEAPSAAPEVTATASPPTRTEPSLAHAEGGATPAPSASELATPGPTTGPAAQPAPVPRPTAGPKVPTTRNNCNPPFTVDANGDYVPKPECFPR